MASDEIKNYIRQNAATKSDAELSRALGMNKNTVKSIRKRMGINKIEFAGGGKPPEVVKAAEMDKIIAERDQLKNLFDTIGRIERGVKIHTIAKKEDGSNETDGVAIWVASDWHIEEEVRPEWVNNLNKHNLQISLNRSEEFFRNGLRLTNIFARDVKVNKIVIALLGDFITNDIHEEMKEINLLTPMDAIIRAQEYIASGIKFILDNSKLNITLVCASGNHARTTDQTYYSTEYGHSVEHYMYKSLELYFKNEPRVEFIVNNAYHTILDILGYKVRFHHGHAIKYGGGIGGLYIPVNKKIAIWNNAIQTNLDVFGHYHTLRDGGSFISNGSQIGYNSYALRNGLPFERPQQALFMIDSKRFKTIMAPILYTE